jgi:hypothetical protein
LTIAKNHQKITKKITHQKEIKYASGDGEPHLVRFCHAPINWLVSVQVPDLLPLPPLPPELQHLSTFSLTHVDESPDPRRPPPPSNTDEKSSISSIAPPPPPPPPPSSHSSSRNNNNNNSEDKINMRTDALIDSLIRINDRAGDSPTNPMSPLSTLNEQYHIVNSNNNRNENEKKLMLSQLQRRKIAKQAVVTNPVIAPRKTTNKFKLLREGSQERRGFSMDRKPAAPVYGN